MINPFAPVVDGVYGSLILIKIIPNLRGIRTKGKYGNRKQQR